MITTMRKTFRNEISSSKMEFFIFFKNFHILSFFWLRGVTFILILNLDKSYKRKILPASIYSTSRPIRKWIQIEIWTDEPSSKFDFKKLAASLRRRLHFLNFPWHRITLRVGMWPSCSTSHWKWLLLWKKHLKKWNLSVGKLRNEIFHFFQKIWYFVIFDRLRDATFVRIFNLEKSHRRENPSG